jgi:hypothetical protein
MAVDGTLKGDNEEIARLNKELLEVKEKLLNVAPQSGLAQEGYITDFEDFEIEILFSENRKKAKISVIEEVITIIINGNTIRIDSNGTIIQ